MTIDKFAPSGKPGIERIDLKKYFISSEYPQTKRNCKKHCHNEEANANCKVKKNQ